MYSCTCPGRSSPGRTARRAGRPPARRWESPGPGCACPACRSPGRNPPPRAAAGRGCSSSGAASRPTSARRCCRAWCGRRWSRRSRARGSPSGSRPESCPPCRSRARPSPPGRARPGSRPASTGALCRRSRRRGSGRCGRAACCPDRRSSGAPPAARCGGTATRWRCPAPCRWRAPTEAWSRAGWRCRWRRCRAPRCRTSPPPSSARAAGCPGCPGGGAPPSPAWGRSAETPRSGTRSRWRSGRIRRRGSWWFPDPMRRCISCFDLRFQIEVQKNPASMADVFRAPVPDRFDREPVGAGL